MSQLADLLNDDWGSPKKGTYPSPCQNIENLSYDYSEKSGADSRREPRFMVLVHFPNRKYRQITHVQEYDIESMVGNIGGYIGLFLGYSLLHFPQFLITLWKTRKTDENDMLPKTQILQHVSSTSGISKVNEINRSTLTDSRCSSCSNFEEVSKQFSALTKRMNDLHSSVTEIQEDMKCSKLSSTQKNSLQKVKVIEWSNSVCKASYNY